MKKIGHKLKLFIILGVEFLAIAIILLLVFFAGHKSYTVTFDLAGGTLLGGSTVQEVNRGKSATPPTVKKEGCYLLRWSRSYSAVTNDIVVRAIWEYETSYGIEYEVKENGNYCEIVGCFADVQGDVYIGAYHDDKKVLGIRDGAFKDCTGITAVYLLDGILTIGNEAFAGCTSLTTIELPGTLVRLGKDAFNGCTKLTDVLLPETLKTIGDGAFSGCSALETIVLPKSLETLGVGVFDVNELVICAYIKEQEVPEGWQKGWYVGTPQITWEYVEETEELDSSAEED